METPVERRSSVWVIIDCCWPSTRRASMEETLVLMLDMIAPRGCPIPSGVLNGRGFLPSKFDWLPDSAGNDANTSRWLVVLSVQLGGFLNSDRLFRTLLLSDYLTDLPSGLSLETPQWHSQLGRLLTGKLRMVHWKPPAHFLAEWPPKSPCGGR